MRRVVLDQDIERGEEEAGERERECVLTSTLENLSQVLKVDAQGLWSVTSVVIKSLCFELKGHEAHVGAVHALHLNASL